MNKFEHYGFDILEDAIGKETAKLLSKTILQTKNNYNYLNGLSEDAFKSDVLVEKAFSFYGLNCLEVLSEMLLPQIENVVGKTLVPTYSYCRVYYNDAEMPEHTDRPSCEYSVTLTLEIDKDPWPIWMRDSKGIDYELFLPVGSMCVYKGIEVPHWRNKYEGKQQIQAFLHYVDVNGEFKDFKYDKRPMLGLHPSTKRKII